MTLGERIKKARRTLDLTQHEFAIQIGSTQNALTGYETGRRNPSAAVLNNICKTFNISETWLRTGEGEMFTRQDRKDELTAVVNRLLAGETSEFKTRLINVLSSLKEEQWLVLEEKLNEIVGTKSRQKPAKEERTIDEQVELYRQQLLFEQEQVRQALSANESGAG